MKELIISVLECEHDLSITVLRNTVEKRVVIPSLGGNSVGIIVNGDKQRWDSDGEAECRHCLKTEIFYRTAEKHKQAVLSSLLDMFPSYDDDEIKVGSIVRLSKDKTFTSEWEVVDILGDWAWLKAISSGDMTSHLVSKLAKVKQPNVTVEEHVTKLSDNLTQTVLHYTIKEY